MKYIDAEKLIHDLEERIFAYSEGYAEGDDCRKDAIETLLKDVRYQCSLQQEQPDFPTTNEQVKEFLATHPKVEVPQKYKTPDWIFEKSGKPMNPDDAMKELEEKIALVKERETWKGVDVDKYMDEVRGREPEKPMGGLEDELKDYLRRYYNCDYPMQIEENTCSPTMPHIVEAARHFAEWGAEHLKK